MCAPNAGDHVGANPVDRGKPGSKIHLACEGSGLPLTAVVTAANISDVTMLAAVLDDVPAVLTPAGRRRTRPGKLDADKGYDSAGNRAWLRRRGITARIARRGIESSQRLGRHRWRVERALSWLSCFRRLQVRWDRDSGRFFAFVLLACALVCGNRLWSPGHAGGVAVVGGELQPLKTDRCWERRVLEGGGGQPGRAGTCLRVG